MLSYSTLLCTIKSAALVASANVGVSQPIWLNVKAIFFPTTRDNCPFNLSPTTMTGELGPACSRSASARQVTLVTKDEWIPPQRPLSDETIINSLSFAGVSSGVLEDFCKMGELRKDRHMSTTPKVAEPYSLPACKERCAFASFVNASSSLTVQDRDGQDMRATRTVNRTLVTFSMFRPA